MLTKNAAPARRADLQRDTGLYVGGAIVSNHIESAVECRIGNSREETAQGIERKACRQGGKIRDRECDRAIGISGDEPHGILGSGGPRGNGLGQESECAVAVGAGSRRKGEGDNNGCREQA